MVGELGERCPQPGGHYPFGLGRWQSNKTVQAQRILMTVQIVSWTSGRKYKAIILSITMYGQWVDVDLNAFKG